LDCKLQISDSAQKQLRQIDKYTARIIFNWLSETSSAIKSRKDIEKYFLPLRKNLKGYWKKRHGDYRMICKLNTEQNSLVLLLIEVGHRSAIYEK
jgi:mRNA-degrading endonuclease RelE of RelBE toxin-antitoxin system